jgi:Arc/MetJ-type ribon-helix-helix transcriptional regulator
VVPSDLDRPERLSDMIIGMTARKVKIAITLDADLVEQVRSRVSDGHAPNVSAYIQHAIKGQLAAEADFDTLLADMLTASGGPPTRRERLAARRLTAAPRDGRRLRHRRPHRDRSR